MKIHNLIIFLFFLAASCNAVSGQLIEPGDVSEDLLTKHVHFLTADSLLGRATGTPELNLAAEYLEEQLKKMGLTAPNKQYCQQFDLTSRTFDKNSSFISILNRKGKKRKSVNNFISLNQNSKIIDINAELVFAGFGPNHSLPGDHDETAVNLKGKVVLYSAGTPKSFRQNSSYRWNNALEREKMDAFFNAGAAAIILVTSSRDTANHFYHRIEQRSLRQNFSLNSKGGKDQRNIFIITPETADKLTGKKLKWEKTLGSIPENVPDSLINLKNNRIQIYSVVTEKKAEVKNVIGIVEGSDPLLKQEAIVFSAHYDHLGTSKDGDIYNGADDNASGVATLLEVAQMFSQLPEKPRRTMIFLFPTAEEIGLLGSEYYSLNPVVPMENTVACINLDMVGRVYEERDSVWSSSSKQVKDFNGIYTLINDFSPHLKDITKEVCSSLDLQPDFSLPQRFFYNSDHYHFHKNKVPVLGLSTGYTADYHKPTDTADRIRIDKMKRVARLCLQVGMKLGNLE